MLEGITGIITKKLWIFLIIFILIIIGIAVYVDFFVYKNPEESLNYISIQDVLLNYKNYIGKNITVRGFYYNGDLPYGEAYITSDHIILPIREGSFENIDYLTINSSGLNVTFVDDEEYYFTGNLVSNEIMPFQIQLIVLSAENVEPA